MSSPRLKVYGGQFVIAGKSCRAIIATTSQRNVAAVVPGASIGYIRDYWSITGNEAEVKAALERPGVLLVSPSHGADFVPYRGEL